MAVVEEVCAAEGGKGQGRGRGGQVTRGEQSPYAAPLLRALTVNLPRTDGHEAGTGRELTAVTLREDSVNYQLSWLG